MTTVPIRQPNYCATCGLPWYDVHTCPVVGSTSGMRPDLAWASREPEMMIVPRLEWIKLLARVEYLERLLNEGSSSWPAIGTDESEKSRSAPRKLPTDEDGNPLLIDGYPPVDEPGFGVGRLLRNDGRIAGGDDG
jgi:hypothetical protein